MGRLTLRFVVGLQLTTLRCMNKLLPAIIAVAVVAVVGCSDSHASNAEASARAAKASADEAAAQAAKYATEAAAMYERAKAGK